MEKKRLDLLLSEKGLTESRSQAQRLVMAGQVRVNGQVVIKSSVKFSPDVKVEVLQAPQFVSRGGEKLSAAIEAFGFFGYIRLDLRGYWRIDRGIHRLPAAAWCC